jgi:hypothetical protein
MPGVTNRYIKYEDAGDQYVGRCVSGRNRMGRRFAESAMPTLTFLTTLRLKRKECSESRMPGSRQGCQRPGR